MFIRVKFFYPAHQLRHLRKDNQIYKVLMLEKTITKITKL